MKRIIALMLCACLVLALAGCGGSTIEYYDDEPAAEATDAPAEPTAAAAAETLIGKGGTGFAAYPADTVVGTVDGSEVTWMEYYYWLRYYVNYVLQVAAQYGAALTSWDANELSSTDTNAQVVIRNAQRGVTEDHAVENEAAKLGVTLSAADQAEVLSVFEQNADSVTGDGDGVCTEEEAAVFEEYLADQMEIDREFFDYLNTLGVLSDNAFVDQYGAHGEKMSDDAVIAYAADNNIMAAKHILLLTVDSNTREALSDEEIAAALATAEELNDRLQAAAAEGDQQALIALFDRLMAEYTEDTGYARYPDGYVFSEGEMVEAFENAVKELDEDHGLSEIVESPYGYHIIMRIPVDPDAVIGTNSSGNEITLRYSAATQQFSAQLAAWTEAANVVWNEGFEAPDLAAIFG